MHSGKEKHWSVQIITWVLLLNFINLSANFYHTASWDSVYEIHHDPMDSLSELVLEFFLDMDQETIPDTEVPEQKRKIKDFKVFCHALVFAGTKTVFESGKEKQKSPHAHFSSIDLDKDSPPPKGFFFNC